MSRAPKKPAVERTASPDSAAAETTPALVNRATPSNEAPAPGGVMSPETASEPAVPSTEPLPSDQATASERAAAPAGEATLAPELSDATVERPSIVPETPPAEALVAPAEPVVRSDVAWERVDSTVPLPADQVSPFVPVDRPSMAAALAEMTEDDRAAMRAWLGVAPTTAENDPDGIRLFPVVYDVDHDGRSYAPGGERVPLTFAEHARMVRLTAVVVPWAAGEEWLADERGA